MVIYKVALAVVLFCAVSNAQRPYYAGLRPIGYPKVKSNGLTDKIGESENVPIEARGDRNFINRFNQMPVDNRPFWYLNWRQYDWLRKNPQTYELRPNGFVDRNIIRR